MTDMFQEPSGPYSTSYAETSIASAGVARTSTERGNAADKALLNAGGAIVSRLRLRPIAARALAILMEREGQVHGRQRAAIEGALIAAAGGAEFLERLLAEEQEAARHAQIAAAAAEAAAVAEAQAADALAAAAAEAAAVAEAQADDAAQESELDLPEVAENHRMRPRLSPIENELVALLQRDGPITGTAEVGFRLWPDREMQAQDAAVAASGILRRLVERGYIEASLIGTRHTYSATESGLAAREQDRIDAIDPRQRTFLDQ